jgi:hypothetical protein
MQWSPTGDWIAYPNPKESFGISLISPDGRNNRKLTSRLFATFGFSKDGSEVYGIYRNTDPEGAEWLMYSVDVKNGAEKLLGARPFAACDRIPCRLQHASRWQTLPHIDCQVAL